MKKNTFLIALGALVLANLLVLACQKENAAPNPSQPNPVDQVSAERNGTCPDLWVYNGASLVVCGLDQGNHCTLCASNSLSQTVVNNPQSLPFANSGVFSVYNPNAHAVQYALGFNCATVGPQTFTIAGGATQIYHVDIVTVLGISCCVAHAGCTH